MTNIQARLDGDQRPKSRASMRSALVFALGFAILAGAILTSLLPLVPKTFAGLFALLSPETAVVAAVTLTAIFAGALAWLWWRSIHLHGEVRRLEFQVMRDADRAWMQREAANAERAIKGEIAGAGALQPAAAGQAPSQLVAEISHEMRISLNGILGMTELLLDTRLTPEQTTYAQAVKTSGETLLALIADVLEIGRIEAGTFPLMTRPFSLALMIEEVVELIAPRAQAKGLEIASYVDERLSDARIGDPARLRQVLLNLAGNAVKFTERGGIAMIVEPGAREHEIGFAVRDTGIGISPEDQSRIFLDFEQVEGGKRAAAGVGLGLAISRRIVQRMGGTLGVDSMPGRGATFTFTVALPPADGVAHVFEAPDLAGWAVLIAATAEIEASLLSRRLRRWGATTRIAADAEAALARIAEQTWNAILVDHALGTVALAALAEASAGKIAHRIVMITPADRHALGALMPHGFTGYLVKPVRAASLAARLSPQEPRAGEAGDEDAGRTATASAGGRSVLIAEDNEINALLARALVEKLGHQATVVSTGTQAIDAWTAAHDAGNPFDLVLMDLHMPGLSGLEAARRMRAIEAAGGQAKTRIVALTANAFVEDREACAAVGMEGFLTKPLGRERLAEVLAGGPGAALAA